MSTRGQQLNLKEMSRRLGDLDFPPIDVYVGRVGVSRILAGGADRNSAVKENDTAYKGAIAPTDRTAPIAIIKATT